MCLKVVLRWIYDIHKANMSSHCWPPLTSLNISKLRLKRIRTIVTAYEFIPTVKKKYHFISEVKEKNLPLFKRKYSSAISKKITANIKSVLNDVTYNGQIGNLIAGGDFNGQYLSEGRAGMLNRNCYHGLLTKIACLRWSLCFIVPAR